MLPTRSSLWRMLVLFIVLQLAILGASRRAPVVAAQSSAVASASNQFNPNMRPIPNSQSITGAWDTELANKLNMPGTITDLVFADDGRLTIMGDFNYLNGQLVNGLASLDQQGVWQSYGLHAC